MDWPVEPGEFVVCDPKAHIAVVTLDDDISLPANLIALYGKSRTENLGVERVVVNTVSNQNIRALVICGKEICGHNAGQAILALWENGIDQGKRIVGAEGAIPYIQNLPVEFIERFRLQVELVDLIGVVDELVIGDRIVEVSKKNLKAFEGDELDFEGHFIKAESALTDTLDLSGCEVSLSPEYDIKFNTITGEVYVS